MATLRLPASATLDNAAELASTLGSTLDEALRADAQAVQVDAGELSTLDTSALSLLMELRRRAAAAGRGFELLGAPPKLLQLAQLYGVDELLGAAPSST
jgi:phospholipid transport system transporter-binding protein